MKKILVGTKSNDYLSKRNFSGLPFAARVVFKKCFDLFKIKSFIRFKFFRKSEPNELFSFKDFGLNRVDLYHFFSVTYYGKKPWVVTSSVPVPRWNKFEKKGLTLLSRSNCKAIILLSENCKLKQEEYFEKFQFDGTEIRGKTIVLPPSQEVLVQDLSMKPKNKLVFIIVGHQILIKGGLELVRAFRKLSEEGISNFELRIISRLDKSGFLDYPESSDHINEIKTEIKEREYIKYWKMLPNTDVLELIKTSSVALLPSYADSYGYSVLEAQACGCPVITTNTSALPEINDNEMGWTIEVPLSKNGRPNVYSPEARLEFSNVLEKGLYTTLKQILEKPEVINDKGLNSLKNIKLNHSPEERANKLYYIYCDAMK
ncbi:MAG: glycosyltransferase family 4 protein [Crocinitomicaceae bacterium]|nr:glycosyltransferase family 4 protein [Crocinitomicaceae bacterium]